MSNVNMANKLNSTVMRKIISLNIHPASKRLYPIVKTFTSFLILFIVSKISNFKSW